VYGLDTVGEATISWLPYRRAAGCRALDGQFLEVVVGIWEAPWGKVGAAGGRGWISSIKVPGDSGHPNFSWAFFVWDFLFEVMF